MSKEDINTFHLSLCRRLAYSVGHVFNDLCASVWFTYLLIYLQQVAGFSHIQSGLLLLWGQFVDAMFTPVIGYISSQPKTACWNARQKTWHFIGSFCVLCSFPFLFTHFYHVRESTESVWSNAVLCGFIIAVFQFGWAATQVAHLALLPQLTPVESERVELSALRNAWTVLSNVIVYVMAWLMFSIANSTDQVTSSEFTNLALATVAIGTVFSLVFHVLVREPVKIASDAGKFSAPLVESRTCREWFRDIKFYQVALIYTCSRLIVNVSQTYWPMYLTETLHLSKQYMAIVPLIVSASGFTASFFLRRFISKSGHKAVCAIGLFISLGSCWYLQYLNEQNAVNVLLPAVLNGVVSSLLLVTSLSMTNNLIGFRSESSAFVFGVMSFADKLANGICIAVIQQFLPCQWSPYQCVDVAEYYRDVIVLFPGAVTVICFLALFCSCSMSSSQTS